jgi:hypothetical protein
LGRLVNAYDSECARVRQDLAIAEAQLRDHQARIGKPFTHDAYLLELTALRDQLKAGLAGKSEEEAAGGLPTVAELAERIKALKASHTVEAATPRTTRRSTTEESVTARIRERIGGDQPNTTASDATDTPFHSDASAGEACPTLPDNFVDRVTKERRSLNQALEVD